MWTLFDKTALAVRSVPSDPPEAKGAFVCFPRLPTEIRLKIWAQGRAVRILTVKSIPSYYGIKFVCHEPAPVLLSVCHESRQEALRFYRRVSDSAGNYFYFNPLNDTLLLDASSAVEWIRVLHAIERSLGPTSKILSLALRNAHACPHTLAVEVTHEKGLRELFVVGEFEGTLVPRRDMAIRHYRTLVEAIERWNCVEAALPKVTAVKEDFWKTHALSLVGSW
jgi:hypothetical protein